MIRISPTTYLSFNYNLEMILAGWKCSDWLVFYVYKKEFRKI